jgi:hypothetical protein
MADHPEGPTNRELLDRIVALEHESSGLKLQINDHEKNIEKLAALVGKHVIRLDDRLLGIDDQLLEVLEKLFPGHARTRAQIIHTLKSRDKRDDSTG